MTVVRPEQEQAAAAVPPSAPSVSTTAATTTTERRRPAAGALAVPALLVAAALAVAGGPAALSALRTGASGASGASGPSAAPGAARGADAGTAPLPRRSDGPTPSLKPRQPLVAADASMAPAAPAAPAAPRPTAPDPLADGLAAAWTFDDGHGTTAADASGHGRSMNVSAGATWTGDTAPTRPSTASLRVTPASGIFAFADLPEVDTSSAVSISLWVRFETPPTGPARLVSLGNGKGDLSVTPDGGGRGPAVLLATGGLDQFPSARSSGVAAVPDLFDGRWHHLLASWDVLARNKELVVDGRSAGGLAIEEQDPVTVPTGRGVMLGDQDARWTGSIDDLRVWNREVRRYEAEPLSACRAPQGVTQEDCLALADLYTTAGGRHWNAPDGGPVNWFTPSGFGGTRGPCGWTGVTCFDGRLARLTLPSAGLAGEIPLSLTGLDALRILDLSGNALTGTVPGELAALPSLQVVDLHANRLTGAVPATLAGAPDLVRLDVSANRLRGDLAPAFAPRRELALLVSYNALGVTDPALQARLGADVLATQVVPPTSVTARTAAPGTLRVAWTPQPLAAGLLDGPGRWEVLARRSGSGAVFHRVARTTSLRAGTVDVPGLRAGRAYDISVRPVALPGTVQPNRIVGDATDPVQVTVARV